jgi:subtilisin family serine protease/subtilase family serine protease
MSRMTSRLASLASLTTLLLVSLLVNRASTQEAPPVGDKLMDWAAARGTVRIIVRLATPFTPEPHLSSPAHVMSQRRSISATQMTVRGGLRGVGHRVVREFDGRLPLMAIEAGPDALRVLRTMRGSVLEIHEDKRTPPSLFQTIPLLGLPTAWNAGFDGTDQIVAILDTGVQTSHPFFAAGGGKVIAEACFSSNMPGLLTTSVCPAGVEESHAPGSAQPCAFDGCEHGTHVAGIAAGDGRGVSDAPPGGVARGAKIIAIQVFSRVDDPGPDGCGDVASTPCPLSYTSDQIAALAWLHSMRLAFGSRRIASANMSLGGGAEEQLCPEDPLAPAIAQLRTPNAGDPTDAGVLTVIAAGNDGFTDAVGSPACNPGAIAVASSTKDGNTVSSFSNIGSAAVFPNLVMAPGGDSFESVTSSLPGSTFGGLSGTSMATPHVAGAIAVLRQIRPTLDVSSVLSILKSTGTPVHDSRPACFGCLSGGATIPRINVLAAVTQVATPNLLVQTLTAPAAAVPGANISVSVSLRNAGMGPAAAPNFANIYLSTTSSVPPGATPRATITFPPLKGGITSSVMSATAQIPIGTAAGGYFIVAVADAGGETETNSNDNSKAVPITIALPDLMVSSVVANPTATAPGANISVAHTIKNLALAPANAPASTSRLVLSSDQGFGDDVDLGTVAVPMISAQGTVSVSRMVQIPPATTPGLYWIFAQANTAGAFAELPGNNNTAATPTPIIVGPDLLVAAATPSPLAIAPGFNVSVMTTLKNQGGQAAGAFDVAVYLSTNATFESVDDQRLATRRVAGLAAGASIPIQVRVPIPAGLAAGSYFLIARADDADEVVEARESNNTLTTVAIQVVRADLAVQSVTAPAAVAPGQNVSVTHVVKNVAVAPGAAAVTTSRLYLSSDPALDVPGAAVLGDVAVPALGGGAMATVTRLVRIPPSTTPGLYWIIARANVTEVVQEADAPTLTNNVRAMAAPVIVGADLIVTTATPSPLALAPGSNVSMTTTVKNQGGQAAAAFDVGLYLSADATFDGVVDQRLATRRVTTGLGAGLTSTVTVVGTIPANLAAGTYFLIVRVDDAGEIGEANEANNTLTSPAIQVVRPDLTVSSVTFTPSAIPAGAAANVSVTQVVHNLSAAPGSALRTQSRLLLSQDQSAAGTLLDLGLAAVPPVAPLASVSLVRVVALPALAPGRYFLVASADDPGTLVERDETNNGGATVTALVVGPDLTVTTAATTSGTIAGANVSVSYTVRNLGVAVGAFNVSFALVPISTAGADIALAPARTVASLAAGGTLSTASIVHIPSSIADGQYRVRVIADLENVVAEADKGNNAITTAPLTIRAPAL